MLGLSHRTASIEERERLAIEGDSVASFAHTVLQDGGVDECVVLSTCNRVEVYWATSDESAHQRVETALIQAHSLEDGWWNRFGYRHAGSDAVAHLMRVTSSLDSLIIGEPQILGQVKQAYEHCRSGGATGQWLNRLFPHAFKAAKRVRTETGVAENAVSVSYAAVELAKKVFGRLNGKSVLVIGAGKMGGLTIKHLRQAGVEQVHLANRTFARATETAERIGATAHALDELQDLLGRVDIVISSTGSQDYIVKHDAVQAALAVRKYRPLFLIDIAVPRDIDPRCERLSNVYVFDVDDLERVVESNLASRRFEAQRAESIIRDEVTVFNAWAAEAEVVPTIRGLREKLQALRDAEVERMKRQNPELSPEAIEAAERMARSLINKVLHEPTISLRQASGAGSGAPLVAAVRNLFALSEDALSPSEET
jgi:glutamyl-tRNA reductase